ncbi:acyl-CoA dehydrogenase family protein [Aquibium microcysteis]|uniref:acyl-CoA dehydrogenase family protein n=1 Tax=Aquibium microcysteis TaxID=675281 RepID=UPI00165D09EB|nr:acyl-CoA dehydrogenase family protein [Aquibium microcysteis]
MNFRASDEQVMLRDSIERFGQAEAAAPPDRHLAGLIELGLFSLPVPAAAGGLDGGCDDVMVMMETIGHQLLGTPALGLNAFADLLGRHGTPSQHASWLTPAIEGRIRVATGRMDAAAIDGGLLTGSAPFVPDGATADVILLHGPAGVFVARAASAGVTRSALRLVDDSFAAALEFERVPVEAIGASPQDVEDASARAMTAAAAMAVGIMERLLSDTLAHVRTRHQFGVPIASFQVVQHRLARLYVSVAQCRSLVMAAALGAAKGGRDWRRMTAAAHALTIERSMQLAHECVQFHGGMGITRELAVSRGHKQLMMLSRLHGSAAGSRRNFDRLSAAEA